MTEGCLVRLDFGIRVPFELVRDGEETERKGLWYNMREKREDVNDYERS